MGRRKPSTGTEAAGAAAGPGAPAAGSPAASHPGTAASLQCELDGARKRLEEAARELDSVRKGLSEAQARSDGNLALLQRVAADYENFKKFAERERAEAVLRERSAVLADFIESFENLERAIEAGSRELPADGKLLKGLRLTLDMMKGVLERAGVRPIEALGRRFDPLLHEAVYFSPDPSRPEYTIAEELRRGYTLNGKVLRTSKVCVVTRPAPDSAREGGTEGPKDDGKEA